MHPQYVDTANTLRDRIVDLIKTHPEIMDMDSPWDLFRLDDFNCKDLAPSLAQAGWALAAAKQEYVG